MVLTTNSTAYLFFFLLQLLPSTGAGAVNAMQDAVILANHLYDMKPTSFETIKTALSDYKEERFDAIKEQYPQSYISAKLLYGHVSQPGMNLCTQ